MYVCMNNIYSIGYFETTKSHERVNAYVLTTGWLLIYLFIYFYLLKILYSPLTYYCSLGTMVNRSSMDL